MDKRFIPVAMLAGALALAGCGGGSDAPTASSERQNPPAGDPPGGPTVTLAGATTSINACGTDACVDGVVTGAAGDLTAAELATLRSRADARKAAIAAGTPLSGLSKAAAEELADALAGGEALRPGSRHITENDAQLEPNEPWKKLVGSAIGGWEARSYNIPNPEGSSGRVQDIRVWQENDVYIRQLYREFFATGNQGHTDGNIDNTSGVTAATGAVTLADLGADAFDRETVPSNLFTAGFTYNADDDRWELRGDFYDVPGVFVCPATGRCAQQLVDTDDDPATDPVATTVDDTNGDFTKPSLPIADQDGRIPSSVTGIQFLPTNFSTDETHVNAKWAKNPNPDFLNFGVYWNTEINDDGEVTTISVDPFAGGAQLHNGTERIVISDEGNLTANYSGGAGGVYVRTVTDANDDRMATGYGEFTADANFTAKFGTAEDSLSGKITNFKTVSGTGADAVGTWEVEFEDLAIKSGAVNVDESFHAQFYGDVRRDKDGVEVRQSNGHGYAPYGLVGTFQSGDQLSDGHVTGAFGTECDGSNCVHN
ncbi:MAG: hypothetical protein OXD36_00880 [Rhodobacter sp.]|nr:hypothetical protein [Rhodobacter sp.]